MRVLGAILLATSIWIGSVDRPASGADTASLDLLRRATDPNPTLQSYTASVQLSATVHAIFSKHKTFDGTVYYLKPKRIIQFDNVGGAYSRFKELAASEPTFAEVVEKYSIEPMSDDGTVSTYSLTPKAESRVKSLTMTVDDATALVTRAEWLYNNGGRLQFTQAYTTLGTFRLPEKTDIEARFPEYSVDGILTFSNYQPGADVSPSVFESPPP